MFKIRAIREGHNCFIAEILVREGKELTIEEMDNLLKAHGFVNKPWESQIIWDEEGCW